ncbi:toxin Doc [Streptomyces mirabilis]|uniref:toxin Doc n=1 Tax=Streptomyces mirabilis TaxID=68239 RepID=UPI0033A1D8DA
MELYIDVRWLLDRQEELLGKELAVRDYSALVAAVARHRVNTPQIEVGSPDAYWRAAALLEEIVLLRPLPHQPTWALHFSANTPAAVLQDLAFELAEGQGHRQVSAPHTPRPAQVTPSTPAPSTPGHALASATSCAR